MARQQPENNDAVLARFIRASVAVLARLIRAVDDPARALGIVGIATCWTVVGAAAGGGGSVLWLVVCFFGGVVATKASVWVSADADRRRATAQILLTFAVVILFVAIALSDFDPHIALNIFDAML